MEKLHLVGTEDTPEVLLDPSSNKFVISGRSLPEDVTTFYQPIMDWLDALENNPLSAIKFDIKLEYFNTASSKLILDILMKLEEIHTSGACKINIVWHYQEDDEDMQEAGDEYKDLVEVPFEIVAY
ncbi:MAG: DUF1987 domain-containing protein [Bacteroidota bacterium]